MMKPEPEQLAATLLDKQAHNPVLHVLQLESRLYPSHLSGLPSSSLFPPSTHGMAPLIIHPPLLVVLSSPRVQTND